MVRQISQANSYKPEVAPLIAAFVERLDEAHIIVDATLTIFWCNRAGQIELERATVVVERNGQLIMVDPDCNVELTGLIHNCRGNTRFHCFRCDGGHVLFRSTEIHRDSGGSYFALNIIHTPSFQTVYDGLAEAFCLTKREDEILQYLAKAIRPDQIAKLMGLRLATVRSHIRNLYDKLGVTSRDAMFVKIAPFRV